jgi:pilus assembly protein CpaC
VTHDGRPTTSASGGGKGRECPGRSPGLLGAAALTATLAFAGPCGAARAQVIEDAPVHHITVTLNKSKTLTYNFPFTTAVIGSPEIADLLPMNDHTLYVQGKKVGTTNISIFGADKRLIAVSDLEVTLDTVSLHTKIASTGGRDINVTSANGEVVLSGEASDAVAAARAVDVAKALSPKDSQGNAGSVINAMDVAPSQQVMLRVRFLEVDRTAGRDLGVNLFGGNKNGLGVSGLGAVSQSAAASATTATTISSSGVQTTTGTMAQSLGNSASLLGGVFAGAASSTFPFGALLANVINTHGLKIDALVSALEDKGLVKTLAEPDLVAQSGKKAAFFAGAQVPVPTVQPGTVGTTPTVTVNYYPCGVTLNFIPTVLNTGLINVELGPQVCQVSSTTTVVVNGTTIPELNTRSADTTVELRDGQSFAVAGLLQAQDVNQLSQLPWLGNVPVLGALFRSTNYQKAETDLIVIVTVHLVKPVAAGKHLVTPFDDTLPANDVDLFLMGDTERKKKYTEFVAGGGGLQGPYGHVLEAQ